MNDVQKLIDRLKLAEVSEDIDAYYAAADMLAQQAAQIEALTKDAERYKGELLNIADTKRFKRDVFETDTEWADWAQSRARYVSSGDAIDAIKAKEIDK